MYKKAMGYLRNIAIICLIVFACTSCTKTKKETVVLSKTPPTASSVKNQPISAEKPQTAISTKTSISTKNKVESPRLPAVIKAENASVLSFQVSGNIKTLNVQAGDVVKKNQILATLDPTLANFDMQNAKVDLESKKVIFEQAERKYTSYSSLLKTGALSKIAFEDEENNFKIAKLNFEAAEINLKSKQYALQLTQMTAPFDGVVSKSYKSLGDLTTPGSSMFDLVQTNNVSVFAQVPVAFFGKIQTGMLFSIINPLNEQNGKITVQKVVPVLDTQSRTFDIYGKITETAQNFFPGMYVEIILN